MNSSNRRTAKLIICIFCYDEICFYLNIHHLNYINVVALGTLQVQGRLYLWMFYEDWSWKHCIHQRIFRNFFDIIPPSCIVYPVKKLMILLFSWDWWQGQTVSGGDTGNGCTRLLQACRTLPVFGALLYCTVLWRWLHQTAVQPPVLPRIATVHLYSTHYTASISLSVLFCPHLSGIKV